MGKEWTIAGDVGPNDVLYTLRWSPWGSMDRWVINRLVPSESGLFQLWCMEGRGLVLTVTESSYYGGLRNSLREVIDELAPAGRRLRERINGRECWFRYSVASSRRVLENLEAWFDQGKGACDAEGRVILVNEMETLNKFPLPPPDVKTNIRKRMKEAEFGPPMPPSSRNAPHSAFSRPPKSS